MIPIDKDLLAPLLIKASAIERKRTNFNFHKHANDTLQRMLNVLNLGTYIRPHKHEDPDKREAFILIQGRVAVIEFEDSGKPIQCVVLDHENKVFGCEIEPRVWHSIICLENNSVVYELKDGPYVPITDKNFAPWAPKEGSPGAEEYLQKLIYELKLDLRNYILE
jgi:cupin fold WbuC family metalloprotein